MDGSGTVQQSKNQRQKNFKIRKAYLDCYMSFQLLLFLDDDDAVSVVLVGVLFRVSSYTLPTPQT